MSEPLTPLAQQANPSPEDRQAAALVQANLPVPEFDAAARGRVSRRLLAAPRRFWALPRGRLATALAVLALSPVATAAVLYYRPEWPAWLRPKAPAAAPRLPARAKLPVEPPLPPPPAEAAPPPAEVEAPPAPPHHKPARKELPLPAPEHRPAAVAKVEPEPSTPDIPPVPPRAAPATRAEEPEHPAATLSQEMAIFREALHALNVDRDGATALRALDDYRRRFPAGAFRKDAFVARVDALMLLGRPGEALRELDSVELSDLRRLPKGAELEVLKGELQQGAGDCPGALAAFDRALEGPRGPLSERALWGRASCRATQGDGAGSRADLEEYLRLFPSGAHAKKARAALAP